MHYTLKRIATDAGVGYFDAVPRGMVTPPTALGHIKKCSNDEFMRRFVLRKMGEMEHQEFLDLVQRAIREDPPEFQAILLEACLMHEKFAMFLDEFEGCDLELLGQLTPQVSIRSYQLKDRAVHNQWMNLLEKSVMQNKPMPRAIADGLALPVSEAELEEALQEKITLAQVHDQLFADRDVEPANLPDVKTVWEKAQAKLEEIDVYYDVEQRHEASLSPIALMRRWNMYVAVRAGRHDYEMSSTQISYGKGLDIDTCRASLYMEIAERVSSFANFGDDGVLGYEKAYPLTFCEKSDLDMEGKACLDIERLPLEVPYDDDPLFWMEGHTPNAEPCLVPPQLVFLFCNLDEKKLFSSLDSTGLASGNTLNQAKVSALLEVLERDAESLALYDERRCFRLEAEDPQVAELLASYREKGVDVVFQDITTDLGVPAYKVSVIDEEGAIIKGTACGLNGAKAALSALLETMYPYPDSPPSQSGPADLPTRKLEDLPNFATGNPDADLELLEALFERNGYTPVYVDLTRKDLGIPVAKAFVPGLQLAPEFSSMARVTPRLLAAYKKS